MSHSGYLLFLLRILKFLQIQVVIPLLTYLKYKFGRKYATIYAEEANGVVRNAKILKVWMKAASSKKLGFSLANFLYTEKSDADPYMMFEPNVLLHGIDKDNVWFTMAIKSMNPTDFKSYESLSHAQYENCENILVMSQQSFKTIMKSKDLPNKSFREKSEVIFLTHTGKSGSSLVCEIFDIFDDVVVLRNPWIFALLHKLFNTAEITRDEYLTLLRNTIEYFVMKFPSKRLVFKLSVFCSPMVEVLDEALESSDLNIDLKNVFMTRGPMNSIRSIIEGFQDSNMDLLLEYEYNQFWSDFTSVPYASNESDPLFLCRKWLKNLTLKSDSYGIWVSAAFTFGGSLANLFKNRDKYTAIVFLDGLIKEPELEVSILFEKCRLDFGYLDKAQRVVKKLLDHFKKSQILSIHLENEAKEMICPEGWEEVKDAFFMLKLPIDVDIDDERLGQILAKRRRKIGLYGPRSSQYKSDIASVREHSSESS